MRRFAAGLLCIAVGLPVASISAAASLAAERPAVTVPLVLDGRRAATVTVRRHGATRLIALEPVATALGWRVRSTKAGAWVLVGEGRHLVLTAGSTSVTDGGAEAVVLPSAVADVGGRPYLDAAALATLFDVRLQVADGAVELTTTAVDPGTTVVERPRPSPKPTATPPGAPPPSLLRAVGGDRIAITLIAHGADRSYQVALATVGALRGIVETTEGGAGAPVTGSMTLGTPKTALTVGAFADPLAGSVFHDAAPVGASLHAGSADAFVGRRALDGRTVAGIDQRHGAVTETIEALRLPGGTFDQIVLGLARTDAERWGTLREEAFAGSRGLGAAAFARTNGRLFGEATLAATEGRLPLDQFVPVTLDAGYDASHATTVRAGLRGGSGTPLAPFVGVLARGTHFGGGLSLSKGSSAVSASYVGRDAVAQVALGQSLGVTTTMVQSAVNAGAFAVELNGIAQPGEDTARITVRRPGSRLELLGGWGFDRAADGSGGGPVVGLAAPLNRALALEARLEPQAGREALRVELVAGLLPPKHAPRAATVPLALRVPADALPARVLVDGLPFATLAQADTHLDVPAGPHTVAAETLDGRRASPAVPLSGTTRSLELALWPVRELAGRIAVNAPAAVVPRDLSLAGVTVVLAPGGAVAVAGADGRFTFGAQPVPPGATLRLGEDGLPAGLGGGDPVAVAPDGDTVLTLRAARPVETFRF